MANEDDQIIGFCEPKSKSRRRARDLSINHWGMIAAAVIGAYGAYRSSKAAQEAADKAAGISKEGVDWQKQVYQDYRPFLMKGLEGYQNLLDNPDAYKKTPGYQFRLQEGLKSVGIADGQVNQRNLTGSQLKGITQYTQEYAAADYDRALNRYGNMAGIAQGAATVGAQYGKNIISGGNMQAGYVQNAGNARAAGYMGMARAIGKGVENYSMTQQQTDSPVVAGDAYQPGQAYYNQ